MATIEERLAKLEKAIKVSDAGVTLSLKGGGLAHLEGAIVRLNGGQRPAALVGSQVIPDFPPFMEVNTGTAKVLV